MVAPAHPLLTETTEKDQTRGAKDDRDAARRDRSPKDDAQGAVEQAGARQRHKTQGPPRRARSSSPQGAAGRKILPPPRRLPPPHIAARPHPRRRQGSLRRSARGGLRRRKSAPMLLLERPSERRCGTPMSEIDRDLI